MLTLGAGTGGWESEDAAWSFRARVAGLDRRVLTIGYVAIQRRDHVGIVVTVVAGLQARGAELVGEPERYEDNYRLCYVRGPEGIIVEPAEQIS